MSHRVVLLRHWYDGPRAKDVTVDDATVLTEGFEANRTQLRAVAYRMLGSQSEADDAVQEAWLRLHRSDTTVIDNLGGWLTTVVARVCLDMLRSRRSRREEPIDDGVPEPVDTVDPEREAVLADSVGLALLVVLDTLAPAERLAFVLHDMFAVPFDEIAPILERTPAATRQLASRARRRVQSTATVPDTDFARQRTVVEAFLTASRGGDFDALLTLLDPDIVVRADRVAVEFGATAELRGADAVVSSFLGRARGARAALVNGAAGAAWVVDGRPRVVFSFTVTDGRITAIDLLADPALLRHVDLAILEG
jgi:RNA polymerase sigma-70 factor (ECF subfamily)